MSNFFIDPSWFEGGGWTPADITTELWYDPSDASTITESSGNVSQMDDKSGNARNLLAQSNPPKTGTDTINSLNVITYTNIGVGSRLVADFTAIPQPMTYIFVATTSAGRAFFDSFNNVQHALYDSFSNFGAGSLWSLSVGGVGAYIISLEVNGVSSEKFKNGVSLGTGNSGTNSLSGINFGQLRGNPNPVSGAYDWGGFQGEFVCYSGINATTRGLCETYLNNKWAIY
tara:strand:- start:433 stop:1119 length:687 start_codon:yes stop_codon:yes gene_type:complete